MAFLVFPLVYTQQHLKAVRNELGRTNEQVVKLEKVVDEANSLDPNRRAASSIWNPSMLTKLLIFQ
jgi:thymidylate synthase